MPNEEEEAQPAVIAQFPEGEQPGLPGLPVPEAKIPRKPKEYPITLTMDEYNKVWKPAGWKIIFIGPTSTWRQEWGTWESIRDIVQNCLDETEAYRWGYDDEGLWISDKGKGVAVADFLLGPPKLKPDWARGKFGEGMKIASLALLREGYPVRVDTVGRELQLIFIEQEVNGKAESLAALWRPDTMKRGTTFHIIGYSGPAYELNFAVNLPKEAILFSAPSRITQPVQRFNQLIDSSYSAGPKIYGRDIYMREITSTYSYNLWGFEMAPDRFGPRDENAMWIDMGRLWACVDKVELLEILLQMVHDPPIIDTAESHLLDMEEWRLGTEPSSQITYGEIMRNNSQVWQTAWANQFGSDAVLRTSDRWDATVKHLGYRPVGVSWNVRDALQMVIKTDVELKDESQERLRDVTVIHDDELIPRQRASLKLARAIVDDICRVRRVKGVHAAIIPPASDRVRTAGMYGRTTEEIYISSEQLDLGSHTVDTVIHEMAHHISGAEDGEEAHNAEMTRLAGLVVARAAEKVYDQAVADKDFAW